MADVKFTGLSAASGIPDNGSVMAISTYDGVSTYTSEKYTMTQLKDIVYVMEAEDKITFDSSGTNKVFFQDETGNIDIRINEFSSSEFGVTTDAGTYGSNAPFIYLDNTGDEAQIGLTYNTNSIIFEPDRCLLISPTKFELNVASQLDVITAVENTSTDTVTGNAAVYLSLNAGDITYDSNPTYLGSVVLGGDWSSTNPIDKPYYAFAQNLEVKGGNLIKTASSTPASAAATGITGQIEWDADYIYVCTATNTWKRTAIATW